MNIRVLKRRLGTNSFNGVFLKICPYDPTSKIQKLEIGSDKTFMQNKLKTCKTGFLQNRKMWFFAYLKNNSKSVLQIFFRFWQLTRFTPKNSLWKFHYGSYGRFLRNFEPKLGFYDLRQESNCACPIIWARARMTPHVMSDEKKRIRTPPSVVYQPICSIDFILWHV